MTIMADRKRLIGAGLGLLVLAYLLPGAPASAQADGAEAPEARYILAPGDRIQITVFGETDLSMEVRLDDSGTLSYPFLGELLIEGHTVSQVEQTITTGLRGPYLVNPVVTVSIVEYRPFFVYGEVTEQGSIPYQPRLTVERAIALAGGFTERGSRNKIEVIRENDDTRTPQAIELSDRVRPGDVITVGQSFF
jgi:protein involved in polysaccharide export with SLBB domain